MNEEKYNQTVENLRAACSSIVSSKRPGYTSSDNDVLINFKQAARDAGITPLQAWLVLFNKHVSSIKAYVKNPAGVQAEPMIGRFADAINYLELGYALMLDTIVPTYTPPLKDSLTHPINPALNSRPTVPHESNQF